MQLTTRVLLSCLLLILCPLVTTGCGQNSAPPAGPPAALAGPPPVVTLPTVDVSKLTPSQKQEYNYIMRNGSMPQGEKAMMLKNITNPRNAPPAFTPGGTPN